LVWNVRFTDRARKELKKLDRVTQARIGSFLETRIAGTENPRRIGAALQGSMSAYWKYRVGDYRIICSISDQVVTVLVLSIGNRREVYR